MTGLRFVENQRAVDRDLENALHTGAQLDELQDRRPSRSDRRCRTDSLIEVVSRNAVFDHDPMGRLDH